MLSRSPASPAAPRLAVGLVGWRGMVGSVLRQRMDEEDDWALLDPTFFSTSQAGQPAPAPAPAGAVLADAHDLAALAALPVILSCQGGAYTRRVHPALRAAGWTGIWIDAASALRMEPGACLVLDPVNGAAVEAALDGDTRDFIGANCTVSLMLMGMGGLIARGWVRWISTMTYQAASGAGARQLGELIDQMGVLAEVGTGPDALAREARVTAALQGRLAGTTLPTAAIGAPLAGSLLPWIDTAMPSGQSREEWKGAVETNRLMGHAPDTAGWVAVDGLCVRVGALRCHAQGLTLCLDRPRPLDELEAAIRATSPWTRFVENTPEATLAGLTPAAVSGTLDVAVGRLRPLATDPCHVGLFTVGDQLLWGAAEPLRRVLRRVAQRATGMPSSVQRDQLPT